MRYASIPLEVVHSAAFRGAEPLDRATWICLLCYCYEQESGGRIVGGRTWGDRRSQQILGVTRAEIDRYAEGLWSVEGDDLVVAHYDHAYVEQVRSGSRTGAAGGSSTSEAKVAAARMNGAKGGRPPVPRETAVKTEQVENNNPSDNPTPNPTETQNHPIKPKLDGCDGRTDMTSPPKPPAVAGQDGEGGSVTSPPKQPTKAENNAALTKLLNRLVCVTGEIATAKWAGVAIQGRARDLAEALECVEWLVKKARADGRLVEYAGDVMHLLPAWEEHRREKRRREQPAEAVAP